MSGIKVLNEAIIESISNDFSVVLDGIIKVLN